MMIRRYRRSSASHVLPATRGFFRLLPVLTVVLASAASLQAQEKTDSPVFKKYRPPVQPPLVEQSEPIFQIWQTFLVSRRANAGEVLAQHELGLRYLVGKGAAADTEKAAYWIKKAADQNYIPARFNFGILAYHGLGVNWDPFEAYRQFRICAEHQMVEAEYAMAQFLTENLVVPRDYEAAYRWVKAAADSGYAPAREALERFEKQGIGGAKADSVRPATKAPNTGLVFIEFTPEPIPVASDSLLLREAIQNAGPALRKALGMSKLLEGGVPTDSVTLQALRQASEAGSPEALTVLGRSYEKGMGVPRDVVKACAYYVRAIRVDSPRALELLWPLLQENGTVQQIRSGTSRGDPEAQFAWAGLAGLGFEGALAQVQAYVTGDQAFRFLLKAGEQGYLPAMVETGLCYYAGRWVPQSIENALNTWRKAADRGSLDARVRIALTSLRASEDTLDHVRDVGLLANAVEEGSVLAEVGLGYCYETGTGVPVKKAEAAHYYRAASVRGSQDAFRALRRMHDAIRPGLREFVLPE